MRQVAPEDDFQDTHIQDLREDFAGGPHSNQTIQIGRKEVSPPEQAVRGRYATGVAAGTEGGPGSVVMCGSVTGRPSLQVPMKRCSGVLPNAT